MAKKSPSLAQKPPRKKYLWWLFREVDSIIARDPAARHRLEVILLFHNYHAVKIHRLNHFLWHCHLKLLAKFITLLVRIWSGIEIHPAAAIGKRLFIDHGMGVVIGETATIGDDVTLYHGVTLGGVSPSVNADKQRLQKRHPSLENNVIVGSGAQILGPITVGQGARVGANAVVVKDVPPYSTVVGIPAKVVEQWNKNDTKHDSFSAYGVSQKSATSDPLLNDIKQLQKRISQLEQQAKKKK
ncbi:MAG: serine O-acetyltransferase EpsC [Alphaproteobacteria bacterium]